MGKLVEKIVKESNTHKYKVWMHSFTEADLRSYGCRIGDELLFSIGEGSRRFRKYSGPVDCVGLEAGEIPVKIVTIRGKGIRKKSDGSWYRAAYVILPKKLMDHLERSKGKNWKGIALEWLSKQPEHPDVKALFDKHDRSLEVSQWLNAEEIRSILKMNINVWPYVNLIALIPDEYRIEQQRFPERAEMLKNATCVGPGMKIRFRPRDVAAVKRANAALKSRVSVYNRDKNHS